MWLKEGTLDRIGSETQPQSSAEVDAENIIPQPNKVPLSLVSAAGVGSFSRRPL